MSRVPTQTEKENQARQLKLGLTHVSTFQSNLADAGGPNVSPVMKKIKAKIEDITSERFSLDTDLVQTTTELIHFDNEFTDNLTGETGGNFADVVMGTFEQHKNWLDKYV